MKIKRLLAPDFWRIPKKEKKYAVAPIPGPHKKFESIPLLIVIRDILKIAEKYKDAKKIIKRGEVLVDGKVRKDHRFPVGLFDVITIPKLGKNYRVVVSSKLLSIVEIDKKEANLKLCKVKSKKKVKGGKLQLTLHDGRNLLTDNNKIKTHDSLLIELPKAKIKQHIPLEKNMVGVVLKGKMVGKTGRVKEIIAGKFKTPPKLIVEISGQQKEVLKRDFFVVGKDKPLITVVE